MELDQTHLVAEIDGYKPGFAGISKLLQLNDLDYLGLICYSLLAAGDVLEHPTGYILRALEIRRFTLIYFWVLVEDSVFIANAYCDQIVALHF